MQRMQSAHSTGGELYGSFNSNNLVKDKHWPKACLQTNQTARQTLNSWCYILSVWERIELWYAVETIDRITEFQVQISLKQKLFNIESFVQWCTYSDEYVVNIKVVVKREQQSQTTDTLTDRRSSHC